MLIGRTVCRVICAGSTVLTATVLALWAVAATGTNSGYGLHIVYQDRSIVARSTPSGITLQVMDGWTGSAGIHLLDGTKSFYVLDAQHFIDDGYGRDGRILVHVNNEGKPEELTWAEAG